MEEQEHTFEQLSICEQRIYVASLSDYNDGRLHGCWISANQEPEEIDRRIQAMLDDSSLWPAEEWAIHDYEGFGAFRLSEYESLPTVTRIAKGIQDHGPAFAHWVNIVGTSDEQALDEFDSHYLGQWKSLEAYAEEWLDDLGTTPETIGPDWLRPYVRIDYQHLVTDLSADLETAEDAGGIHVFEVPT